MALECSTVGRGNLRVRGSVSDRRQTYFLLRPFLRDPGDDFVIELAVAGRVQFIVTHNVRDFAGAAESGVKVIRPHEFLRLLPLSLRRAGVTGRAEEAAGSDRSAQARLLFSSWSER